MDSVDETLRAALAALRAAGGSGGPLLSLVAPVRDEEEALPRLVARALDVLAFVPGFEIILVDDGSRDRSPAIMGALGAAHGEVRPLGLGGPRGQSAALWHGIRAARAPVVATIDADLQQDPGDLPKMIARLPGADAVVGYRTRRCDSLARRAASRLANRARDLIAGGPPIRDSGCSLRVARAEALAELVPFDGMHRFLPTLLAQRGFRVLEVPVGHSPRRTGRSKYGLVGRGLRGASDVLAVRWMGKRVIGAQDAGRSRRP